jgi:hypothetical protein
MGGVYKAVLMKQVSPLSVKERLEASKRVFFTQHFARCSTPAWASTTLSSQISRPTVDIQCTANSKVRDALAP